MLLAYERQPATRSDFFAVVPDVYAGFFVWTTANGLHGGLEMLVLSRRERESVYIGEGPDRIEVCVAEIQKGRVLLGITAPAETRISRSGGPGTKTDTTKFADGEDEPY